MKQLDDALRYRQAGPPPRSTRDLMRRFDYSPHDSVMALLRRTGPFIASRDAYRFSNSDNGGWPITEEDALVLRERYQPLVDPVSALGIDMLRRALVSLSFSVPPLGTMGLPEAAIDFVANEVTSDLRNQLLDKIVGSIPGQFGRCGGMAFSAFDFFLIGWPVDSFNVQPTSGDLRQYIWNRLLDSLEENAFTFLEWIMVLHVLPVISRSASKALGLAAGAVIGGPLGAVVGALVAPGEDVLGLGGPRALLDKTREHWGRLKTQLDHQPAWPIGLTYGDNASPIGQHQVLAIGYEDHADSTAVLKIWDNNDGALCRELKLDFRSDQLLVESSSSELANAKGIICEEYAFKAPPASLNRPRQTAVISHWPEGCS